MEGERKVNKKRRGEKFGSAEKMKKMEKGRREEKVKK